MQPQRKGRIRRPIMFMSFLSHSACRYVVCAVSSRIVLPSVDKKPSPPPEEALLRACGTSRWPLACSSAGPSRTSRRAAGS